MLSNSKNSYKKLINNTICNEYLLTIFALSSSLVKRDCHMIIEKKNMSSIGLIIEERAASIGLSTLTYQFEGAIMHRDSIGSVAEITPGAVNWMTAGKGVVHSERTPERLRDGSKVLHGMQIWVALPEELEESEPSFTHIPAEEIPAWEMQGIQMKLIAGEAFGRKSPVPVHSPLYLIELKSDKPQLFTPGDALYGESGLYILKGEVRSESYRFGPGQLLIANDSRLCSFEMGAETTLYLFGGEPFPEKRYIDWNFVSSRRDRLRRAKEDWIDQRFPEVPGETDFVPYPQMK